jgi:hypothetical protein
MPVGSPTALAADGKAWRRRDRDRFLGEQCGDHQGDV